ncbi:hypothetical protein L1887_35794 [Cichorium endivia]|nr:hypothetical protein L1887_35794 [Cichorium endivia]
MVRPSSLKSVPIHESETLEKKEYLKEKLIGEVRVKEVESQPVGDTNGGNESFSGNKEIIEEESSEEDDWFQTSDDESVVRDPEGEFEESDGDSRIEESLFDSPSKTSHAEFANIELADDEETVVQDTIFEETINALSNESGVPNVSASGGPITPKKSEEKDKETGILSAREGENTCNLGTIYEVKEANASRGPTTPKNLEEKDIVTGKKSAACASAIVSDFLQNKSSNGLPLENPSLNELNHTINSAEPIKDNVVNSNLQGISERLKMLLDNNTPIKDKLEGGEVMQKADKKAIINEKKKRLDVNSGSYFQRLTRSQLRRKNENNDVVGNKEVASSSEISENSFISLGILQQMEEKGDFCGFSRKSGKGKG